MTFQVINWAPLFQKILKLSSIFLTQDPATWEINFDYEVGWKFCQNLPVVKDTAECGVKFMKDYHRILIRDEEQVQFLLQVVEAYKNKYTSYKNPELISWMC